jgi:hypothetical protein
MRKLQPTSADILAAIADAETGDWIDPTYEPIHWFAELRDPEGEKFWNGCGHDAGRAMALAWLHYWAPDALIESYVEPGSVPLEIPNGFSFELTSPQQVGLE